MTEYKITLSIHGPVQITIIHYHFHNDGSNRVGYWQQTTLGLDGIS